MIGFRYTLFWIWQREVVLDRYSYTLREVKGNIWGHGLGSWGKNYWGDLRAIYDYPHNILLEIAYETGVLSSLLFV